MVDYAGTVSGLSAWLEQQADNTPSTAYTIQCSGDLTYVALGNAIRPHTTKYVDLSPTMWNEEESGGDWIDAFKNCVNLVIAPIMYPGPQGVISCREMFMGCTALKGLSSSIPENIRDTSDMFNGCTSFSPTDYEGVNFPSALQNMTRMFQDCTSLVELKMPLSTSHYVKIPTGVDTTDAFKNCTSLVYAPDLNSPASGCTYATTFVNCPNPTIYWNPSVYGAPTLHELLTRQGGDSTDNYGSTIDTPIPFNLDTDYQTLNTEFYNNENVPFIDLSKTTVALIPEYVEEDYNGYIYFDGFACWYTLVVSPEISNYNAYDNIARVWGMFENCRSLKTVTRQIAPSTNGKKEYFNVFKGCSSLEEITIEEGWKTLDQTFSYCTSLTTVTLPKDVISFRRTFEYCTSLTEAPVLKGVTSGTYSLNNTFEHCTSLVSVPIIPNGLVRAVETFYLCFSLKVIEKFETPISTIKNNINFRNMFRSCPKLEQIGFKIEESDDWHVFRLKFGSNSVEGKIFDKNKNATTIPSTSITKSSLVLPVLSDELLFTSSISDSDLDDLIEDVIDYKYTYFGDATRTIDPTQKSFVLWAEDTDRVITNLSFPADVSHASGVLPVANGGTGQTDLTSVRVGGADSGVYGRLGGAKGASATNFTDLIAEVSSANGGGGICGGSINTSATDKGIPAGWYNFLYVPHRTGTGGDNYKYGTLYVSPMTSDSDTLYVIHHVSGTVNNAKVFKSDGTGNANNSAYITRSQTGNTNNNYSVLLGYSNTATTGTGVYVSNNGNVIYNPSTQIFSAPTVNGGNLPLFSTCYSSSSYASGYFLLAQLEGGASAGNHSVSFSGRVVKDSVGTITISDFYVFVRGNNASVGSSTFINTGIKSKVPLVATYQVFDTNKFRIRLYGQITANWQRFNTVINYATTGDVSERTSNLNVTFPNTQASSVTGTQITENNVYDGTATTATTASDSSKLNGYASDTSATANTIVRRNAYGYIYGVYYNCSAGTVNIADYTNPYLIFTGNGDGWFRKCNIPVKTSSIGGTSTETGNHWAYITNARYLTTSGYVVYSDGLKIQWGEVSKGSDLTKGNSWDVTINSGNGMALAYTSKDSYKVFVTYSDKGGGGNETRENYSSRGVQTFYVTTYNRNGSNTSTLPKINWFTIGY